METPRWLRRLRRPVGDAPPGAPAASPVPPEAASLALPEPVGLPPNAPHDATGALRRVPRPPAPGERGDYQRAWDAAASQVETAYAMVDGSPDEAALRASGARVAAVLRRGLAISPTDRVLELGCGVGRIGRELAPACGEWHGVDISPNMIRIAATRTAGLANVRLRALPDSSLSLFADATFDRVYSHIVLFHMDKEDMFGYLGEFRRVLRPDGLAYFDTWNLDHPFGWQRFLHERELNGETSPRPINRNQFSTPQEAALFTRGAGLGLVGLLTRSSLTQVVAVRPEVGERADVAAARWRGRLGADLRALEPGSARLPTLPTPAEARLTVDSPLPGAMLSGRVELAGWALHPAEIDDPAWGEVAVFCVTLLLQRGAETPIELGRAAHNLPRPDVAEALGEPRFRDVGWRFAWDSRHTPNGDYTLWVEAHLTCGYRQTAVPVRIAN